MDFGDFIRLVGGLAFLIFWIFSSAKKQRRSAALAPRETSGPVSAPELTETEKMIREALGIVDDHSTFPEAIAQPEPKAVPKTTSRARVTSDPVERIVDPLAFTEAKSASRHERFHQRYDKPKPVRKKPQQAKNRLGLRVGSIRSAIVWREILGSPKSLE